MRIQDKKPSIPKYLKKYILIFLSTIVLFIISFTYFQNVYAVLFLKPVSISGFYILEFLGLPITFSSATLILGYCDYILPHQILRVNYGCTGLFVMIIYISAIVSFPTSLKSKIKGVGFGVLMFTAYSILRLVIMGLVGNFIPAQLEIIHNYLMLVINIAFVIWLFTNWIDNANKEII